jgi:hypothetical protein
MKRRLGDFAGRAWMHIDWVRKIPYAPMLVLDVSTTENVLTVLVAFLVCLLEPLALFEPVKHV